MRHTAFLGMRVGVNLVFTRRSPLLHVYTSFSLFLAAFGTGRIKPLFLLRDLCVLCGENVGKPGGGSTIGNRNF